MNIFGFEIRKKSKIKVPFQREGTSLAYNSSMSDKELLQNTSVASCVEIIADAVAVLSCNVYKTIGETRLYAREHPLFNLFKTKPNEDECAITFFQTIMMNLLLNGNAFIFVSRKSLYDPTIEALNTLQPDKVTIKRNTETGEKYYLYKTSEGTFKYGTDSILHIPAYRLGNLRGLSPIEYASSSAHLGLKLDQYTNNYFDGGIHAKMALTVPKEYKNWGERDSDQLVKRFLKSYGGAQNALKPIILNKGMEAKSLDVVANNESQLVENRSYSEKEIAKIYRVPLFMLCKDDSKFANNEQANTFFLQHTLTPWIVRLQQYFSTLLSEDERKNYFVEFNTNSMLRADVKTRMETYVSGITNGIYAPNDVRKMENIPLLDDKIGGTPFIPVNMMQLTKENLDAYMAQQKKAVSDTLTKLSKGDNDEKKKN